MGIGVQQAVFFPIEITTREYAGHLLLATELAARGVKCVIGHKAPVVDTLHHFSDTGARGVLYYKGDNRRKYSGAGFIAVGQDPEAGVVFDDFSDFYARRPHSLQQLDSSAAYFCFGPDDYEFLRAQYGESSGRIHPTGSPRVELWGDAGARFRECQVQSIKERYGDFVLIASGGGRGNPHALQRLQACSDSSEANAIRERLARGERRASLLAKCARNIIQAEGLNVVVRPHPAESWKRWREDAASIPGLYVDSAGDLNAWVRAAAAVVQNSSTTAFESWFAGTPVLAFGESFDDIYAGDAQGQTPNHIAMPAVGQDGLLAAFESLESRWQEHKANPAPQKVIERKLYPPGSGAVQAITDIIEGLVDEAAPSLRPLPPASWLRQYGAMAKRGQFGREKLGRRRPPPTKKWPLTLRRVRADVEAAREILGVQQSVSVRKLAPNTFLVGT